MSCSSPSFYFRFALFILSCLVFFRSPFTKTVQIRSLFVDLKFYAFSVLLSFVSLLLFVMSRLVFFASSPTKTMGRKEGKEENGKA